MSEISYYIDLYHYSGQRSSDIVFNIGLHVTQISKFCDYVHVLALIYRLFTSRLLTTTIVMQFLDR